MISEVLHYAAPLCIWSSASHRKMAYISVEGPTARQFSDHETMRRLELGQRRGFGSIKLSATCGNTSWNTSAFPQKDGSWFMPIRKLVTSAECLEEDGPVELELHLL